MTPTETANILRQFNAGVTGLAPEKGNK